MAFFNDDGAFTGSEIRRKNKQRSFLVISLDFKGDRGTGVLEDDAKGHGNGSSWSTLLDAFCE